MCHDRIKFSELNYGSHEAREQALGVGTHARDTNLTKATRIGKAFSRIFHELYIYWT